ncbi:MAG: L,D-transpeptidase family protein [Gammaproteobacteria bacterium]|nr:L,D-transpeptidase family protein [Gammaproteobacteria bacterium]
MVRAATYALPTNGDNIIGASEIIRARADDNFFVVGLAYGLGYTELQIANPTSDPLLLRGGAEVLVPTQYVLPDAPYEGIVINVPEMRLYYFPPAKQGKREVVTFPIGIGRQDWMTPKGLTRIVRKQKDPAWYPPESIRKEHADEGDILPKVVPPGPDNPLGRYAMRLAINGYLIHGTNRVYGIGMRVTHGCIRMYPDDIESLFAMVPVGTSVRIVNQPFKIGRLGDSLHLEVHPYLEEDAEAFQAHNLTVMQLIVNRAKERGAELDWDGMQRELQARSGVPRPIGRLLDVKIAARP